jgi:hypothetical protein
MIYFRLKPGLNTSGTTDSLWGQSFDVATPAPPAALLLLFPSHQLQLSTCSVQQQAT